MGMREAYQEKADAQLREWQAWIEQYKSAPLIPKTENRADHQQVSSRLEDSHRIAQLRLEELRSSKDDRWEFAKQAVERAMIDLKQMLDESGAGQSARLLRLQNNRLHIYETFTHRTG